MTPTRRQAAQLHNSRRSGWRQPGARDDGQRYIVSYVDGTGQRRDYGFTDVLGVAQSWVLKIERNPLWGAPLIRDRKA